MREDVVLSHMYISRKARQCAPLSSIISEIRYFQGVNGRNAHAHDILYYVGTHRYLSLYWFQDSLLGPGAVHFAQSTHRRIHHSIFYISHPSDEALQQGPVFSVLQ